MSAAIHRLAALAGERVNLLDTVERLASSAKHGVGCHDMARDGADPMFDDPQTWLCDATCDYTTMAAMSNRLDAIDEEMRAVLVDPPAITECAECSAKPGSPALCQRCLDARAAAGSAWRGGAGRVKAPIAPSFASTRDDRQASVESWVRCTFGDITMSMEERASRFLEEAVELVQACELHIERARAITQHVYGKPRGRVAQEAGGVGVTLLALCASAGISADRCERDEFDRVLAIPAEHFRARHNAKAAKGIAVRATGGDK